MRITPHTLSDSIFEIKGQGPRSGSRVMKMPVGTKILYFTNIFSCYRMVWSLTRCGTSRINMAVSERVMACHAYQFGNVWRQNHDNRRWINTVTKHGNGHSTIATDVVTRKIVDYCELPVFLLDSILYFHMQSKWLHMPKFMYMYMYLMIWGGMVQLYLMFCHTMFCGSRLLVLLSFDSVLTAVLSEYLTKSFDSVRNVTLSEYFTKIYAV